MLSAYGPLFRKLKAVGYSDELAGDLANLTCGVMDYLSENPMIRCLPVTKTMPIIAMLLGDQMAAISALTDNEDLAGLPGQAMLLVEACKAADPKPDPKPKDLGDLMNLLRAQAEESNIDQMMEEELEAKNGTSTIVPVGNA